MAQATYTIPANQTGSNFRALANLAMQALGTSHLGSSAPSYAEAGMIWADNSANPMWVLKLYDGTDWIAFGTFNVTTNTFKPTGAALQDGSANYAADAGANDTYAITLSPALGAYAAGNVIQFKANTANTGAATLNVNALGAKTIKKYGTVDLSDNDILANQIVTVVYDGTNFQLMSLPNLQYFIKALATESSLADDDVLVFSDTSDSGKNKGMTVLNAKSALSSAYPIGYHGSGAPVWASTSTFTVPFVRERNSANDGDITKAGSTTVDIATTGINGLAQSANLTGTISYTNASATVTGSGTSFTTDFVAGDPVWDQTNTIIVGTVSNVGNNTTLTLKAAFSGTGRTGVNFRRGGEAANTHYHLYAITDGATPGLILSTRNVAGGDALADLPSGYTKSRQLAFSVWNNASKNIAKFQVSAGWPYRPAIDYEVAESNYNAVLGDHIVLNAGTATSFGTPITCSMIPPTAKRGKFAFLGSTNFGNFKVRPTGSSSNGQTISLSPDPGGTVRDVEVNGSGQFDYLRSTGSAALTADCIGFTVTEVA